MKTISLIGSTGSIGRQVLSVVRRHSDKYKVESIVANSSAELFLQQVNEFRPKYAALVDESIGKSIASQIPDGVKYGCGKEAALEAIAYGKTAFVAATGFAGLEYSLSAIAQGKEFGHSTRREVGYLVVHSVLHLLGYDHLDEGPQKVQMRKREEEIISGIPRMSR